jgi:hypothetical protein
MRQWSAQTLFDRLAPGTALLIFEVMTADRVPISLGAGDKITVSLGGNSPRDISGLVEQAASDSALLAMSDGGRWTITPKRADEPATAFTGSGGPSEEWVVRSVA